MLQMLEDMSIAQLLEVWDEVDKKEVTPEIATVRGWVMDELEKRDSIAFENWIDNYSDSPRKWFQ